MPCFQEKSRLITVCSKMAESVALAVLSRSATSSPYPKLGYGAKQQDGNTAPLQEHKELENVCNTR